jgi:hypothetical protein
MSTYSVYVDQGLGSSLSDYFRNLTATANKNKKLNLEFGLGDGKLYLKNLVIRVIFAFSSLGMGSLYLKKTLEQFLNVFF